MIEIYNLNCLLFLFVVKTYEFQCRRNGDCPVTSDTRRHCNCCRLAKCFRVGMDRNAIRTDDQRLERKRLVEANRVQRAEQKTNKHTALTFEIPNQNSLVRISSNRLHFYFFCVILLSVICRFDRVMYCYIPKSIDVYHRKIQIF